MKKIREIIKKSKNILIIILLLLILGLSIFLYKLQNTATPIFSKPPLYHFCFVEQNSVDPFWKEIKMGAEDAAKYYNVAVEFNAPEFDDVQEERQFLDIAITSKVDGIITPVSGGADFTSLINNASKDGIPVVTIENDDTNSDRKCFIGSNSFLLGQDAGNLMEKATKGKANIAVIVSNDYEMDAVDQNLKINGFLTAIKQYPNMKVVKIYNSKLGTLSAEEITQSILSSNSNIDAIYTTDSVDTLGTAQVVVDFNKVGKISIVGYGDTSDILSYIDNGIIYGTVMGDPYKMGYESVKSMLDIKRNQDVSTFIDTGVNIITKDNLSEYKKKAQSIK